MYWDLHTEMGKLHRADLLREAEQRRLLHLARAMRPVNNEARRHKETRWNRVVERLHQAI